MVKTSNGPIRAIRYVTCDATGHKQKSPEWREVFAHAGESAAKLVNIYRGKPQLAFFTRGKSKALRNSHTKF
ncbi:hypothetical protein PEC302110_17860 [Pectobacterium araliae]|uniref:Uncharacterized protein n=1 Tax=Pectobacterium araliae TaxID=3073862 RepID=A0AAN0KAE8_9GAMM|nr:hypothetical protein PEC302110_17860 [Pectobacterium sp. MAFF 302110]